MARIGRNERERPLRWRPSLLFLVIAVVVVVVVALVFEAVAPDAPSWVSAAVSGAIVGGSIGLLYPWLYDRVERGRDERPE